MHELMRSWDRNGDGSISKIELRACVRNALGLLADNGEIDGWFAATDADGGGSLSLSELQTALRVRERGLEGEGGG